MEIVLDKPRKLGEVVKSRVQDYVHPWKVHAQVSVHEHVPKAGDAPKPEGELSGQDTQLAQNVDGARIVGSVTSPARRQMRRDVERILGAQLETPLHRPALVSVGRKD